MKNLFTIAVLSLLTSQSFGAIVKAAKLDATGKNIMIDVAYAGGCGKHEFFLKMGGCFETYPVRCSAELIEKTDDTCEALIGNTVKISLAKYKLNDSYFKSGSLTITGDKDWQTNKASQVTVKLP